ncbi:MAG: hypothetical protein QG563_522 [Patescibacteria group bacterium]|jgi:hypothetical protein|nr:hypothetical protein [Patescibacteria group bacterium]
METNVKKGFYYNFKHNSEKGIFDGAYYVLSTGRHTETGEKTVTTLPLYNKPDILNRPVDIFLENIESRPENIIGQKCRFEMIHDKKLISELIARCQEWYEEILNPDF